MPEPIWPENTDLLHVDGKPRVWEECRHTWRRKKRFKNWDGRRCCQAFTQLGVGRKNGNRSLGETHLRREVGSSWWRRLSQRWTRPGWSALPHIPCGPWRQPGPVRCGLSRPGCPGPPGTAGALPGPGGAHCRPAKEKPVTQMLARSPRTPQLPQWGARPPRSQAEAASRSTSDRHSG